MLLLNNVQVCVIFKNSWMNVSVNHQCVSRQDTVTQEIPQCSFRQFFTSHPLDKPKRPGHICSRFSIWKKRDQMLEMPSNLSELQRSYILREPNLFLNLIQPDIMTTAWLKNIRSEVNKLKSHEVGL